MLKSPESKHEDFPSDQHTRDWPALHTATPLFISLEQSVWVHIERLATRCLQTSDRLARKEFLCLGNGIALGCFMRALLSQRCKSVRQDAGCSSANTTLEESMRYTSESQC